MARLVSRSVQEILHYLGTDFSGVCAIDGPSGSGKSTLAEQLSKELGIPCTHVDDYVTRGAGSYEDFVDYNQLAAALKVRPCIVEGICLTAVLQRMALNTDVLIFVSPNTKRTPGKKSIVDAEVQKYLFAYKPDATADILHEPSEIIPGESLMQRGSEIDIALINSQTKLALTLAFGGICNFMAGLLVLVLGVTGQDQAVMKLGGVEMSATGLGGVILATSAAWGYFAYLARSKYSQSSTRSEKRDPHTGITEVYEHHTRTALIVERVNDDKNPG